MGAGGRGRYKVQKRGGSQAVSSKCMKLTKILRYGLEKYPKLQSGYVPSWALDDFSKKELEEIAKDSGRFDFTDEGQTVWIRAKGKKANYTNESLGIEEAHLFWDSLWNRGEVVTWNIDEYDEHKRTATQGKNRSDTHHSSSSKNWNWGQWEYHDDDFGDYDQSKPIAIVEDEEKEGTTKKSGRNSDKLDKSLDDCIMDDTGSC